MNKIEFIWVNEETGSVLIDMHRYAASKFYSHTSKENMPSWSMPKTVKRALRYLEQSDKMSKGHARAGIN